MPHDFQPLGNNMYKSIAIPNQKSVQNVEQAPLSTTTQSNLVDHGKPTKLVENGAHKKIPLSLINTHGLP